MRSPLNINDKEIELMKTVFKGNEDLLKTIRWCLLGLPLSADEVSLIKSTFQSSELLTVFKRRFLPEFDKNSSIGQVQDLWMGAEKMVYGQSRDTIEQSIQYKEQSIAMTRQGFERLVDPENAKPVDLAYSASKYPVDPLAINLMARNQFISHVEQQLLMMWMIVNQPEKAPTPPTGSRTPTRGKGTK